jgi:tRNA G18 (ribose-2'-O)-methylase SpoU
VLVDTPDHPLLADFVALNDPATRRAVERTGGYFVVEGVVAIERLLAIDGWTIRSLALLPRVAERLAPLLAHRNLPVAVTSADVLRDVVGFDLHRGALASVERRAPCDVDAVVVPDRPQLLVAAEGLNDHENLGALYRNAAAFGCAGVVLDPTCADPFYRRSVRVSQGNVLAIATAAMGSIEDLRRAGAATVALTPRADTTLTDLDAATLGPGPVAVVVGAEGPGLCDATIDAADHRAAIPMAAGVDSLNVATAAAIALFHLQAARLPPAT